VKRKEKGKWTDERAAALLFLFEFLGNSLVCYVRDSFIFSRSY
jgi:hypothetical protein